MQLKVMVTGKNRKIASDISDHLVSDRGYSVIKCASSKEALFNRVPAEMPHIIIICLGDETTETVSVFDVLKECTKMGGITIIVIANDADQKLFINNTKLERMFFMSRPVSLFAFYEKLNEIEKTVEEGQKNGSTLITEFVNPHASDLPPRKHILVVDDDSEQLFNIKEQLKEFYEVTLVPSGEAALKFMSRHRVDLVLLDHMMPVMNGPQVLEHMRMIPALEHVPVVFLTGVTEKDTVVKTLVDYKPQGYIVKPSTKSELVAKIIDIMG
ncbi:MAG: response regulator [Lachnospiraceae bacterium]|nr:response regulator [Lachnospiraceae bacterium]